MSHIISFIINLSIHVFILTAFLSTFYFLYISKLTRDHVNNELSNIISKETTKMLDKLSEKTNNNNINWKFIVSEVEKLKKEYTHELPYITEHNKKLLKHTVCFLIIFATVILFMTTYAYMKNIKIRLKFIFAENFIIFFFVGIIEFLFFTEIASKYIPVTPDTATLAVVNRVKERIEKL